MCRRRVSFRGALSCVPSPPTLNRRVSESSRGRDLAKWVGQIGLIESRAGSKAFSQLYAALALRHFGRDLKTNPLWQGLAADEQKAWLALLNPERFYDPKTNRVINLPENYLGVAARIASIGYELGVSKDREFLDKLIDRSAVQFLEGHLYADDAPPTGRYDRYSNEYARYVWEAAEIAGRKDILDKLRPSLKTQMRLWWDIVSEDGYGYNWGRSQGVVSYLDTPEIAGFLASHAEFRPAPLAEIAALYYQAWKSLLRDYRSDTHLLNIFAYGRGNYAYISREREWQQTTGFFGKLANSHTPIMSALEKEGIASLPVVPTLPPVARFEFFRRSPERVSRCLGGATRCVAVYVADHDRTEARDFGLLARAVWFGWICRAGRANLSGNDTADYVSRRA